ncbi:MAG: hypothetical protein K6G16_10790 [Lachnospiraceae bacterium]|nr:hypothetical protein [Lachnospiraceae bacterium]
MKIWAHRGCSQNCPENTMTAFAKAIALPGLAGIELDIQLTRDGEMVVIHDERVDRTTDGIGFVQDHSLAELKLLHIHTGRPEAERIPTINEVLDLLEPFFERGGMLNIELKNSIRPYPGMEDKIVALTHARGVSDHIVYSTFYAHSLEKVHALDPEAKLGVLDSRVSDCLLKAKGLDLNCALHPFWQKMDLPAEALAGRTVRAWLSGHLYPEKPTGGVLDLAALEAQGITDVILNEPERYAGA